MGSEKQNSNKIIFLIPLATKTCLVKKKEKKDEQNMVCHVLEK